jgi:nicotinamide riboside kinase
MNMLVMDKSVRIAVVGPCSSGKSLLAAELRQAGV